MPGVLQSMRSQSRTWLSNRSENMKFCIWECLQCLSSVIQIVLIFQLTLKAAHQGPLSTSGIIIETKGMIWLVSSSIIRRDPSGSRVFALYHFLAYQRGNLGQCWQCELRRQTFWVWVQLCHLGDMWPGACYFISLCLNFFLYKMGIIIGPSL